MDYTGYCDNYDLVDGMGNIILSRVGGIKVVREFLPVGQGAFYCEKIYSASNVDENTIVYDCGSYTLKKEEKRAIIRNTFKENERIEILFLSHFHADHINMVEELLSRCQVKNIVLPYLSKETILTIKLHSFLEDTKKNRELVFNYLDRFYSFIYSDSHVDRDNGFNIFYVSDEEDLSRNIVRSGKKLDICNKWSIDWHYIPFNIDKKEEYEKLHKALEKEFDKKMTKEEVDELLMSVFEEAKNETITGEEYQKVKQAYTKSKINTNKHSLLLYSGLLEHTSRSILKVGIIDFGAEKGYQDRTKSIGKISMAQFLHLCLTELNYETLDLKKENTVKTGCLFTGDYDATKQWDELYRAYQKYWNEIGCVQIPHHGSKAGFHEHFLDMKDTIYFTSVGQKNAYGHPSKEVLSCFKKHSQELYQVHEMTGMRQILVLLPKK